MTRLNRKECYIKPSTIIEPKKNENDFNKRWSSKERGKNELSLKQTRHKYGITEYPASKLKICCYPG